MNDIKFNKLYIGLMSGTSMDGIDAALVDCTSHIVISGITFPYSPETKSYLLQVQREEKVSLKAFSQLNRLLGEEFAQAALTLLKKSQLRPSEITAIGSHGQTICHDASAAIPYTVQLACAHTIAERTGIPVVADFRTRDLVLGGQGAPFAPMYHQFIFKEAIFPLAVINIGGIANLSYLINNEEVKGYDLGPGNCLMDDWIGSHLGDAYDKEGAWAASGQVIEDLLNSLLQDPYFKRKTPKSIGREYFSLSWLENHLKKNFSPVDVQATLLEFTASSIALGIKQEARAPEAIYVCGGGAHNTKLLQSLAKLLPEVKVQSTQALHIDPDFIEAAMFAWLAAKAINQIPSDLSKITGSKRPQLLGIIYPAGIDKRNCLEL